MNEKMVSELKSVSEVDEKAKEMVAYFERTGSYRAADVVRVLGDQRDHCDVFTSQNYGLSSWIVSR
jgi:hypothetical protein